MKVTEKQLLVMRDTLMDSLRFEIVGGVAGFMWPTETRRKIAEAFINQQSDCLKDVQGEIPQEVNVAAKCSKEECQ